MGLDRVTRLSATSILALAAATTAYAQDSVPIDEDTIIVLGTKQGLSTQEAEVSVEIFNEARLDNEALFALDDVLARVPNVVSNGGSDITIRGIGRFGVSGQGVTSNVYLDGAPISTTALSFGLDSVWDIAQIEVLKGPQSTVQGRNALAGAVVLRVNDPTYEWESKFRARYGSFNTQQFAGVLSGPIIEDQLAFRLSADYQSTDGFITNGVTLQDQNSRENLLVRGKLLVEPEALPDLRAEFTVDYNEGSSGDLSSGVTAPTNITQAEFFDFEFDEFISIEVPAERDTEILRILTDIEYELNYNLNLQFIGTYEDASGVTNVGDVDNPSRFAGLVADNSNFFDDTVTETYSAELRMYYAYDRWSGSFGGYFFEEDADSRSVTAASFAPEVVPFTLTPSDSIILTSGGLFTDVRNYAFYSQTRFDLNDKWTFDFSIRYDNERFTSPGQDTTPGTIVPDSCVINVGSQTVVDAIFPGAGLTFPLSCQAALDEFTGVEPAVPETTTYSAILPRGAVTYNVSNDLSVFFTGQRGYRAGGTFTLVGANGIIADAFDPEFLTTYEVGFRSQYLDGNLTFNGNVFYSLYRGQQVSIPGPRGSGVDDRTENAGSSRIYGAEFQSVYHATDDLTFNASVGLLQAEFTDFPFIADDQIVSDDNPNGFSADSRFRNLDGNSFPNAPTLSFNVGADYNHASGFFTNVSVAYTGARESDIFNLGEDDFARLQEEQPSVASGTFTERVESRTVANARIGYTDDRFSLYVYGTNLLNDETPIVIGGGNVLSALPDGTVLQNSGIASSGVTGAFTASQFFAPPRIIGVGLDLNF